MQTLEAQWHPLWQAPGRRGAPHTGSRPPKRTQGQPQGTAVNYQNFYRDIHGRQSPLPQLPDITLQRLLEVLNTYKATTGLGIDELNPRTWRLLPVVFLVWFFAIIHAWEQYLEMLEEWYHLIVFKSKPEGGFRPIAQRVSLLRVWSKLRHDMAAEWERLHPAPFFWGVAGKACDRAGWEHKLHEEAATALHQTTASLFGDIAKFYDNVTHHQLWKEGLAVGFHPRLLLLMLFVYAQPRIITMDGAHSDPIPVSGTILPGCSLATTGAKILMFGLLFATQSC